MGLVLGTVVALPHWLNTFATQHGVPLPATLSCDFSWLAAATGIGASLAQFACWRGWRPGMVRGVAMGMRVPRVRRRIEVDGGGYIGAGLDMCVKMTFLSCKA